MSFGTGGRRYYRGHRQVTIRCGRAGRTGRPVPARFSFSSTDEQRIGAAPSFRMQSFCAAEPNGAARPLRREPQR